MAAFDLDGDAVNVGSRVTILGNISAVAGALPTSNITIQPPLSSSTFVVPANDVYSPVTQTAEGGGATGVKLAVGQDCTVTGRVTAISGSGNTATLTVVTTVNGTSISVPSGACNTDGN